MKERIVDASHVELDLGDKVYAGRSGYCYKGYIYRIDPDKVCISATDPKEEKPQYIGYSFTQTPSRLVNPTSDSVLTRVCYSLLKADS